MTSLELERRDGESLGGGVSSVELKNFRNYEALTLSLDPGFNVIAGPNAQGKTNFLESLYLLATTRMLRGQRDAEAIREGGAGYVLEISPIAEERHETMGDGETLSLGYDLNDPAVSSEELLAALAACRPQDIARGGTSVGPHRDDLSILVDSREARLY